MPKRVRATVGQALFDAQCGREHPSVKALKSFEGRSVLEIIEDDVGSTYRAVYTVRFADFVYVLHAFQKKSKRGIATPAHELTMIKNRLRLAEKDYEKRKANNQNQIREA